MPKKILPHNVVIVTATVTLSVPDGSFGVPITAVVLGPVPASTFVKFTCQAETGGEIGWAEVQSDGSATFTPGPTPTWSAGAATGNAWVVAYSQDPNGDVVQTILSDIVSFAIAA